MSLVDWLLDFFWPKPKPEPKPEPKPDPVPPVLKELLDAHNAYRATKGLPPLALNSKLNQAAQKHAEWMVSHGLRHTGFPGRLRDVNYAYSNCGENIAWNYKSAQACTQAWINSMGHRRNILGNFTEVGFGVSGAYWCGIYAKPATGQEEAGAQMVAMFTTDDGSSITLS